MTKQPTKRRRWPKVLLGILAALLAVAVLLGGVYAWLYNAGRQALFSKNDPISAPTSLVEMDDNDQVIYNGETYQYNDKVTAILFMGVDKSDIQQNTHYGNNGQADSLFLAAIDTATGAIRIIPLSRESMVDVNLYAADGTYLGVEKSQLCLAYAYGNTAEKSCENVVRSVKRLLYGVPIASYIAIDLEGIQAMTDAIGGLRVTAMEDISLPPHLDVKKGQTVHLTGKAAQLYIQYRGQDVQANNRRMQRQKQFLGAFISSAGSSLKKDFTKLTTYYNTAKPYVVSDLTISQITYLASCALGGNSWQAPTYIPITGNTMMGEKYVEFYADPTAAYEAVLQAFYTKTSGN